MRKFPTENWKMFKFKFKLSVNLCHCSSTSTSLQRSLSLWLPSVINMPPNRTASTSKRKASPAEEAPKVAKKAKAAEEPPSSAQPKNKTLPVNINFPSRIAGTLRLASWNVAGLAASQKKGFKYYVEAEDPDILVLTETKVCICPTCIP